MEINFYPNQSVHKGRFTTSFLGDILALCLLTKQTLKKQKLLINNKLQRSICPPLHSLWQTILQQRRGRRSDSPGRLLNL